MINARPVTVSSVEATASSTLFVMSSGVQIVAQRSNHSSIVAFDANLAGFTQLCLQKMQFYFSFLFQFASNANTRFQSFFMLMTIQPFCLASAMSASLNVPIFDSAP